MFSRDFFDNTKPHEMVQRTGDSWNGELQGFGGCPNANVRARLHEFMEAQRRGSSPPQFLYLVFVFRKQLQRPLCSVCRLLCRNCNSLKKECQPIFPVAPSANPLRLPVTPLKVSDSRPSKATQPSLPRQPFS